MFSQRPRTGKFERLMLVAAYVLAVVIGERAAVSPCDDWPLLRSGFAEATRLYIMFNDDVCMFTNVVVGDGAIRTAASCTVIHGLGDEW